MSPVKRLERYFSAFFKLGRTARQAKAAAHSVQVLEPRLDALGDDLYGVVERLEAVEHGDLAGRLDGLAEQMDGVSGLRADTAARLEGFAAEARWLGTLAQETAGKVAGLHGLADQIAAVETDGNGRLGALEQEIGGRLGALEADLGGRFATVQDDFGGRLATLEREMGGHLATLEREMGGRLAGLEREMGGRLAGLEQAEAEQRTRAEAAEARAEALGARLAAAEAQVDRLGPDIARSARAYSEVTRRLDLARFRNGEDATPPLPMAAPEVRTGLDALLDTFYNRLEDRYRGTRADIRDRLRVYLPDVAAARARADRPVLDLGCGRGEWVELLTAEGVPATGVDLNAVQIADARAAGLDVHEGDALRTLADAPDGAYSVITAHHLIEHLPFETVTWMTREALRVLAPGGILIYETPNPRNLIVGATTFHIDPTHRKPLGAEVMTTLLDTIGFHPVEARPLHPYGNLDAIIARSGVHEDVARLLFGPQDLAMIATRPKEG